MKSSNPALTAKAFENYTLESAQQDVMTLSGTINKTGILFALAVSAATISWRNPQISMLLILIGFLGGFAMAIITSLKKNWSPVTTPIYALLQGAALGGISLIFEQMFDGIVMNALLLTFGVMLIMLTAYKTGVINPTEKFKAGVVSATGAIALAYLASMALRLFGVQTSFFSGNSMMSIAISGVIVVVAALNLVLDFDFIENASGKGLPKHMEWYAAFGLMVTLIWLYLEILRLLAKLNSRR
ncbi:hypothetical protein CHISP_1263 [Chitinispirillum alkaliphilum]|nr:hypothetical protein CHISP_1263 [Chitinispirillum alkaliphilum]